MIPHCPCCNSDDVKFLKATDGYDFFTCGACHCIFIDPEYLTKIDKGFNIVKYDRNYWEMELIAAKERSYSSALARMAEAVYYCKRPIKKFLDIGTGPGYFLDAVAKLLPDNAALFYGIELFPPDEKYRTRSKNYIVGDMDMVTDKYDCGICMEVVEHLTPSMVSNMLTKLAGISNPGALYIFNTGMPDYVLNEDMGYLDPVRRGHLVSYSLSAMEILAGRSGFTVHRIIGKTWAFALEFTDGMQPVAELNMSSEPGAQIEKEDIRNRIWHASAHNLAILCDSNMGCVLKVLGLETSRAY